MSAVRWPHSLVTSRMPSTGSTKPCGVAVAPMKLRNVFWSSGATSRKITRIAAVIRPIETSSQKPARVSAILRSSTRTRRENGTFADPEMSIMPGAPGVSAAALIRPLLP